MFGSAEHEAEHERRTRGLERAPDAVEARRESAALEEGDERGDANHDDEDHRLRLLRL